MNKDREFWAQIREWDVVVMMETWIRKEGWKRIRDRLPDEFKWEAQWAKKRNKKGRGHGRDVNGKEKVVNKGRGREGAKKGAGRNDDGDSESRREEVEGGGGVR